MKKVIKLLFLIILLLVLILSYYAINRRFGIGIPCVFYELTGYKCPGCGMTRAVFSIIEGNFKAAFSYNKTIILVVPFLFGYVFYKSYLYLCNREMSKKISKIINIFAIFIVCLLIVYGILRNI